MKKRSSSVYLYIVLLVLIPILLYTVNQKYILPNRIATQKSLLSSSLTPTPTVFKIYTVPQIEKKQVYKIVMIGDSMTAALGPHGGGLSEYINSLYKKNPQYPQRIIIDNYSKSSNILAVNDELTQKTSISEYTFGPLLSDNFDLILVESFGYNPLSQFGVEDGIKKQNEALDHLMNTLMTTHPKAAVVFVATISPNRKHYAEHIQPNNSAEERTKQAEERISYIKNHIEYANIHNIPLVNIYEKSLDALGEGNRKYINMTDDIHPSFEGVDFIGHEIANFIYNNQILPQ